MSIVVRSTSLLIASLVVVACSSSSPSEGTSAASLGDDGSGGGEGQGVTLSAGSADDGSGAVDTGVAASTGAEASSGGSSGGVDSSAGDTAATSAAETGSTGASAGSTTGDPDTGNTIYEVQDGTLPTGTNVEIHGVVVTGTASNGFFAEEPDRGEFSGVFVFSVGGPDTSGLAIGDVVDFGGVTAEYQGITEVDISAGTLEVVASDSPLEPDLVDAAVIADALTAEPWESVLVRVEGHLVVTNIAASNEFTVDDGSTELRIDDFLYEAPTSGDFNGFAVGASFAAISGPLNYLNDLFKIAPRGPEDFEGYDGV